MRNCKRAWCEGTFKQCFIKISLIDDSWLGKAGKEWWIDMMWWKSCGLIAWATYNLSVNIYKTFEDNFEITL